MTYRKTGSGLSIAAIMALFIVQISCSVETATDLSKNNIIPVPRSVTATWEAFEIRDNFYISLDEEKEPLKQIGGYLSNEISSITGMDVPVISSGKRQRSGRIYLKLADDLTRYPSEGYRLDITKKSVTLEAGDPAGLFRGVQTLRQIVMMNSVDLHTSTGKWIIPTGTIQDHPEYSYRGTMLDVSRHFFGVEDVKRYIDLIALYKLNVLHLHLSDDQGWRIEIKSWPRLTEIGGSTQVGGGEGGFYTQEAYKEIVKYAAEKYITVIPEIDMPGHTNAALASYAELNCNNRATKLYTGTRVGFSTLCTGNEITYQFIDDVIGELASITPGPYIHIGGDESHVTAMEDYIPFINRVQEIVNSHGKIMIGWDEIVHADLKPESVAQYWASSENAQSAVSQGAKIIMSPANRCYLDMQYDSTTPLGLHWIGFIEVDTAYIWHPETLVKGITKEDILGIESPLWTETVTTIEDIEYMAFPRLIGHAEIAWTSAENREWESYKMRLARHGALLDSMNVHFYRSGLVPWTTHEEVISDFSFSSVFDSFS